MFSFYTRSWPLYLHCSDKGAKPQTQIWLSITNWNDLELEEGKQNSVQKENSSKTRVLKLHNSQDLSFSSTVINSLTSLM